MKKYSFWFHYNKLASKAQGIPVISFHYQGKCHLVNNIKCNAKTEGRISKRQPYFVMAGKCISCLFIEKDGFITVIVDL